MPDGDSQISDAVVAADAALERCRAMASAGQARAALGNAKQAVLLYRQLVAHDPATYRPDLALALHRVADTAAAIGRRDEALASAEESVALFRSLATAPEGDSPSAGHAAEADDALLFRPYLGAALCSLAARLHDSGADEAALTSVREGIHLFDNADAGVLRQHRTVLDTARLLRNELSPDEHLLDEEFGTTFADSPDT